MLFEIYDLGTADEWLGPRDRKIQGRRNLLLLAHCFLQRGGLRTIAIAQKRVECVEAGSPDRIGEGYGRYCT